MPDFEFTSPEGKKYTISGPAGATKEQAFQMLQTQLASTPKAAAPAPAPEKPFGQQLDDFIGDVPRILGRTARVGLQGVGNTLDFLSSPIRGGLNLLPGVDIKPGSGQIIANGLGLPQPRPGAEAVADSAAEMVAGAAVPLAAGASMARNSTGVTQGVGQMLAAQPTKQLASAAAAGGAGAYVRETGGGGKAQFAASLLAGLAAPFAMGKAQQIAGAVGSAMRPAVIPPAQIDIHINNALQPSGMTLGELPANIQAGIRQDVAKALQVSDNLSPDAVRRLADYRMTGTTPTAGGLSLDPAIVTQQKNLAKMGINSKDAAAQQLGQTANQNNNQLINKINELGAGTAGTQAAGGRSIIGALEGRNDLAKKLIGQNYDAARATGGRSAALDPHAFSTKANNLLDDALLGGKLPSDVRNLLNKAATGEMPLTVDVAEQFKTRIGDLQRATMDKSEKAALSMVRNALDDAPLLPGQQMGQQSIDAFNKARQINRSWMQIVEKTPALQAVRDGIEPDKFVQQFITGGGAKSNIADVRALRASIKSNPEAMTAVKEQITSHLKAKALGGAADEVGSISQANYNKALNGIGDEKLAIFFTKQEIDQMKAIGRVASYEQFQPVGSAVNNSNTAGTLMANVLDRIAGSAALSKIPFGNSLQQPAQNIVLGMQSKTALNVPNALSGPKAIRSPGPRNMLMSPAMFMGQDDK